MPKFTGFHGETDELKTLNVAELIKFLKQFPDDTDILAMNSVGRCGPFDTTGILIYDNTELTLTKNNVDGQTCTSHLLVIMME